MPIILSGRREAAGRVIGIERCGGDPGCHDGDQSLGKALGKNVSRWKRSCGDVAERHREALPIDPLVQAGRLAVGGVIAQTGVADAGHLVGQRAQ